jgi:hypothetical protein
MYLEVIPLMSPVCVLKSINSVYLIYDPTHEALLLGNLSAMEEANLAKEIAAAGAPGMQFLYMGFYIHTCQKMKYKGQYIPSFLLDPVRISTPPNRCYSHSGQHIRRTTVGILSRNVGNSSINFTTFRSPSRRGHQYPQMGKPVPRSRRKAQR